MLESTIGIACKRTRGQLRGLGRVPAGRLSRRHGGAYLLEAGNDD